MLTVYHNDNLKKMHRGGSLFNWELRHKGEGCITAIDGGETVVAFAQGGEIHVMTSRGGNGTTTYPIPVDGGATEVALSPDEHYLAYVAGCLIGVMSLDNRAGSMHNHAHPVTHICWSQTRNPNNSDEDDLPGVLFFADSTCRLYRYAVKIDVPQVISLEEQSITSLQCYGSSLVYSSTDHIKVYNMEKETSKSRTVGRNRRGGVSLGVTCLPSLVLPNDTQHSEETIPAPGMGIYVTRQSGRLWISDSSGIVLRTSPLSRTEVINVFPTSEHINRGDSRTDVQLGKLVQCNYQSLIMSFTARDIAVIDVSIACITAHSTSPDCEPDQCNEEQPTACNDITSATVAAETIFVVTGGRIWCSALPCSRGSRMDYISQHNSLANTMQGNDTRSVASMSSSGGWEWFKHRVLKSKPSSTMGSTHHSITSPLKSPSRTVPTIDVQTTPTKIKKEAVTPSSSQSSSPNLDIYPPSWETNKDGSGNNFTVQILDDGISTYHQREIKVQTATGSFMILQPIPSHGVVSDVVDQRDLFHSFKNDCSILLEREFITSNSEISQKLIEAWLESALQLDSDTLDALLSQFSHKDKTATAILSIMKETFATITSQLASTTESCYRSCVEAAKAVCGRYPLLFSPGPLIQKFTTVELSEIIRLLQSGSDGEDPRSPLQFIATFPRLLGEDCDVRAPQILHAFITSCGAYDVPWHFIQQICLSIVHVQPLLMNDLLANIPLAPSSAVVSVRQSGYSLPELHFKKRICPVLNQTLTGCLYDDMLYLYLSVNKKARSDSKVVMHLLERLCTHKLDESLDIISMISREPYEWKYSSKELYSLMRNNDLINQQIAFLEVRSAADPNRYLRTLLHALVRKGDPSTIQKVVSQLFSGQKSIQQLVGWELLLQVTLQLTLTGVNKLTPGEIITIIAKHVGPHEAFSLMKKWSDHEGWSGTSANRSAGDALSALYSSAKSTESRQLAAAQAAVKVNELIERPDVLPAVVRVLANEERATSSVRRKRIIRDGQCMVKMLDTTAISSYYPTHWLSVVTPNSVCHICSLSLALFPAMVKLCGHSFHQKCLFSASCPVCTSVRLESLCNSGMVKPLTAVCVVTENVSQTTSISLV